MVGLAALASLSPVGGVDATAKRHFLRAFSDAFCSPGGGQCSVDSMGRCVSGVGNGLVGGDVVRLRGLFGDLSPFGRNPDAQGLAAINGRASITFA